MGTINYSTSNYITLGYNTNDLYYDDQFHYDDVNFEYDQVETILNNQSFYYFHITIKPGYYEGFSLDIENNFSYCFNDYREKLEAQKEITQIKKLLFHLVDNFNICAAFPGWCTRYADYKETITGINEAVKTMREEVRTTPTYYTLNNENAIPLF